VFLKLFPLTIAGSGLNWCIPFFAVIVVVVGWLELWLVCRLLHACFTVDRWYGLWVWLVVLRWSTVFYVVLYPVVMWILFAGCILFLSSVNRVTVFGVVLYFGSCKVLHYCEYLSSIFVCTNVCCWCCVVRVQVGVRWTTDYCPDWCSGEGSESALWGILRTSMS
jgi:hypothetical protein